MAAPPPGTVLVAGASGLIGETALRAFAAAGWSTIGLSRSLPAGDAAGRLLAVDLTDPASCRDALGPLRGVTHVVYAALQEGAGLLPGWFEDELIERNGAMLRHLFDALDTSALEHVSLLQGTKAYGVHHPSIGPARAPLPLRERAPRVEHPNFYWLQEDELRARKAAGGFGLTIFRPTVVYGTWGHHNMNPLPAIAAYGALQQARGEPLHFPGSETVRTPREAVDAELVARALVWAATAEGARDATFNLTNGDVFCWESVWPELAATFGVAVGEHRPMSFAGDLPRRDEEWAELVARHGLRAPATIEGLVGANSLVYADVVMAQPPAGPILNSTIAVRRAGFADCVDTADMFVAQLRAMAAMGAIPPLAG
jgi:nucleoside-diphosphate-sugar epimerase